MASSPRANWASAPVPFTIESAQFLHLECPSLAQEGTLGQIDTPDVLVPQLRGN